MSISKNDIISFGKVLNELGNQLQDDPDALLNFLNKLGTNNSRDASKTKSLKKLVLSEILATSDTHTFLADYTIEELKEFIKENHYGVPSKPTKEKLIQCIMRNTRNDSKDAFLNYKTPAEKQQETEKTQ